MAQASGPSIISHIEAQSNEKDKASVSDEEILDELENELDDDFDLGALRERRMEELKKEMDLVKDFRNQEHGKFMEVTDEKEVIRISSNEKRCVIHFYHKDFRRCEIMNRHLETIAPKYFATRFLRVFVENVPWLVEKLSVKVLPCVICFVDGVSKDRLIGFGEFGNADGFETAALELRLQSSGVIDKPNSSVPPLRSMFTLPKSNHIRTSENVDGDSDFDD